MLPPLFDISNTAHYFPVIQPTPKILKSITTLLELKAIELISLFVISHDKVITVIISKIELCTLNLSGNVEREFNRFSILSNRNGIHLRVEFRE